MHTRSMILPNAQNGQLLPYLTPALVRRVQNVLPANSPIELRLAALVNPWDPATAVGQLDGVSGRRDIACMCVFVVCVPTCMCLSTLGTLPPQLASWMG